LSLHRIWAQSVVENRASTRVLEKIGMHCEGQTREPCWMKGRWWDMVVYGIREHEWQTHRGSPPLPPPNGSTPNGKRSTL
jgi:RimJ/RimL family protein N-acetyltransferase